MATCVQGHSFTGSRTKKNDDLQTVVRVSTDAMLQQVFDQLHEYMPASLPILGPIRCHQTGEILHDFSRKRMNIMRNSLWWVDVDQWPSLNVCIGIIRPDYVYKFKTAPYQFMHFFAQSTTDDSSIKQMFENLGIDWALPILLAGPTFKQATVICKVWSRHGTVSVRNIPCDIYFCVASEDDIRARPMPNGYEYVSLTSKNASELASHWGQTGKPYQLADIETLMECFPFRGIKETSTAKLVAHGGQLHGGSTGMNWVAPEHRGKKLFQALISRMMVEIIGRHGFAYADIDVGNFASSKAFANIGFRHEDGHVMHYCYFHPSASEDNVFTW